MTLGQQFGLKTLKVTLFEERLFEVFSLGGAK